MRNSRTPAGPGRPVNEQRDAATAREELEELPGDTPTGTSSPASGEQVERAARHAERDSSTSVKKTDANSPSRDR